MSWRRGSRGRDPRFGEFRRCRPTLEWLEHRRLLEGNPALIKGVAINGDAVLAGGGILVFVYY